MQYTHFQTAASLKTTPWRPVYYDLDENCKEQ